MSSRKRVLRQRVWSGDDKAGSREVGENLRNAESAILGQLPQRSVTFENQAYTADGLVFSAATRPLGIINIYSETADGTVTNGLLTGMKMNSGAVTVTFSELVPGTRYATIRLLVIG